MSSPRALAAKKFENLDRPEKHLFTVLIDPPLWRRCTALKERGVRVRLGPLVRRLLTEYLDEREAEKP